MGCGHSSSAQQTESPATEPPAQPAASPSTAPMATADSLNILLQEDLTIRGGAQLWLMNCGTRLQAAGHKVTFLLPSASLIIEDCEKIEGAKVCTYDADAISKSPGDFKQQFTELLTPAQVHFPHPSHLLHSIPNTRAHASTCHFPLPISHSHAPALSCQYCTAYYIITISPIPSIQRTAVPTDRLLLYSSQPSSNTLTPTHPLRRCA